MPSRETLRDEAILFGANTMYEVLEAIAARRARQFHGAELAHETGRTRAQVQRELSKLRKLGIVRLEERSGSHELLAVANDELSESLLKLPKLLKKRLGAGSRHRRPPRS